MTSRIPSLAALLALATAVPAQSQTDSSRTVDTVASGGGFRGPSLRRLPVDDPRQAFALIPGVVLRSGDIGIAAAPDFSIRGGIPGRASVYIDGAPLRFQTFGTQGIGLAANAIAAVSVTTGVAPAVIADAGGGGVVEYVTPTGGDRLAGQVRWDSDEPFGDGVSVGYNRLEGSLGGPLPIASNLSFFLSATLQGQLSSYRGLGAAAVPTYMPAGLDTTVDVGGGSQFTLPLWTQWDGGLRRPFDWSTARRAQAKVEYRHGASSISLTGIGGDLQQRFFPGQLALVPGLYGGRRMWSAAAIVNWRHDLGTWRGGPLALDVNVSLVGHRDASGPLNGAAELETRDPSLGLAFAKLRFAGADILGLPVTEELIRDVRTSRGLRGVPFFGIAPDVTQSSRINPYGLAMFSWPTDGLGGRLTYANERRLQGRWILEWRPGAVHRVAIGADAERSDVSFYSSDIVRQIGTDVFAARPRRVGVFAGDRLALGHAVIEIGLRYDRFSPGGELPTVPAYISSSGPAFWNPSAATDDTAYANSVARVFHPGRAQGVVSPRVRLAHAIGPRTSLRVGYSRTVEPPTWQALFGHSNSDLSFTNVFDLFGRDVDFVVSSLIEVGVRSALGPRATVDVALYRKDLPDYVGRLQPFSDPQDATRITTINVVTPFEDAHAQGIDVGLTWRRGSWLTATAAYSLARTHTEEAPLVATPADVTAQALGVYAEGTLGRGVSAVVLARAQSGAPYTRLVNNGTGALAPGGRGSPAEQVNSSRLPWTKRLDLRVAKTLRAGGRGWTVYLDARNVLNMRNLVALFAETGGTTNDVHRAQTIGGTFGSGEYGILWSEASDNGALQPDTTVNLGGCAGWGSPVNCVALTRVERRFGNGDGLLTLVEQQRAFNAYYDDFFGAWRLYGAGRTLRFGVELEL
jgi:outer membrane receptor protein involved in Fe transport